MPLTPLDVDEERLRRVRQRCVRVICGNEAVTDAEDAQHILEVLGIDPREGKLDPSVELTPGVVAADRSRTQPTRSFNNPSPGRSRGRM